MGIDLTGLRALNFVRRLDLVDFSRTVMLGRQEIHFTEQEFTAVIRRSKSELPFDDNFALGNFSEPLLQELGAQTVDSVDAADYEGATISHDFNLPVSENLHGRYSCYLDFGSMEHVFSPRDVVSNINAVLMESGTALIITNANGFCGHGFYQFSPEFFFNAFSLKNGFCNTHVFLVDFSRPKLWSRITDPATLKSRNTVPPFRKFYVVALTQKASTQSSPRAQQSDYAEAAWSNAQHRHLNSEKRTVFSRARPFVNAFTFARFRHLFHSFRDDRTFAGQRQCFDPDTVSPDEFRGRWAALERNPELVTATAGGTRSQ
jgi:SAM-dependent methyltransferase